MARVITPKDAAHAEALAKALIAAAGDAHHDIVRTDTTNGLAFIVSDDELADRVVAEIDGVTEAAPKRGKKGGE